MAYSVETTKLLTALVIFLCGLLSTISPLFVAGRNEALFSCGNMLAAGVLLAAGLVHQLADSSSTLDEPDGYPWSFSICGFTFIMFLIFEESVHLLLAEDHNLATNSLIEMEAAGHHSCGGSIVIPGLEKMLEEVVAEDTKYGSSSHNNSHGHSHDETLPLKLRRASSANRRSSYNVHPARRTSQVSIRIFGEPRETIHHHHDDHISEHLHGSLLASLVLLMALSIHSVLEGLSIGLVKENKDIYSTAFAIVAHKVFAGYALGSTMAAADLGYDRCVVLGVVFASSTPLGIFIGMWLGSFNEDSSNIGVAKAIVAGTFLYVSIMEVGMKELLICRHNDGPLLVSLSQKQLEALKLCSMLLGFLGMSYLAKFV